MYTEIKKIHHHFQNGSSVKLVQIVADKTEDMPESPQQWAVGSRCDVLENGGRRYVLNHAYQWEEVGFSG